MPLQSRDSRAKSWPGAQHPGVPPDHRVHVPTSAERRRIRKARARRRVLATLTATLLIGTGLTAGAFMFPEATAEVVKAADWVKPSAGWTAMFPGAPTSVKTAATENAALRAQPWRTSPAPSRAEPGLSKPYPTQTASVSAATPRIREFDWLPEKAVEAVEPDAAAMKLRATVVSTEAAAATPESASASPALVDAVATAASVPAMRDSAAQADELPVLKVRTVTTTSKIAVARVADAPAPTSEPPAPNTAAIAAETTVAAMPDAPASMKDAPAPELSGTTTAETTRPAPDMPVPPTDPSISTSAAATAVETTAATAPDTTASASLAAAVKPDALPIAVERAIATASDTPTVANVAVGAGAAANVSETPAAPTRVPAAAKGPSPADVVELIKRARGRLGFGDIAGARLLLERAASGSDPNALMALAETYDPAMLARLGVRGPKGDSAKARELYERAAESGAPEASMRELALR